MPQLYLTLGQNGGIWINKPNAVTGTGVLVKEASGTTEALYSAASDSPLPTTAVTFTATTVSASGTTGVFRYVTQQVGAGSETVISGTNAIATTAQKGWLVDGTGVSSIPVVSKSNSLVSSVTTGSTVTRTYDTSVVIQSGTFSVSSSYTFIPTTKIVVVGTGGSILLSNRNGTNPGTWQTVHSAGTPLFGIAYGNGSWVAVGQGNKVLTSTDGYTWTTRVGAQKSSDWQWITYGNGTFVAVGGAVVNGQEIGTVMFSTDGGVTWTRGNSGSKKSLSSIAYSPELNKFVAVGVGGAIVTVDG